MGAASFVGLALLGCGPLACVFIAVLSRKSFLVLLTLGSAFYWLVTLFLISSLFRGWAPLQPSPGPYAALLLIAVLIQELARVGIWHFHRLCVRVLNHIAQEQRDRPLSVADRFSLTLTYGFSHGAVHSTFFFASWLPLSLGSGTVYSPHCPRMSYFLVAALTTLAFAALLTGGMVLWFDGMEQRVLARAALAPAAHTVAALLTLVNFVDGGCLVTVPLLLAGGGTVAAYAGHLWWQRTTNVPRLMGLATTLVLGSVSSGASSAATGGGNSLRDS